VKPRIAILNGRFDPLTMEGAVDAVFEAIGKGERGWLCTVNVATLMTMRGNQRLQAFVDQAKWVVADGQPLVWCSRLFGTPLPERVAGIDLLDALCRRAAEQKKKVYLLGTTAHLLERTRANLRRRHPGLEVDGSSGYFKREEWPARADAIRASGASLLCVGMGTPRQEFFIAEQWDRLGAAVAIGVGGSFDVIAGARFRAHPWVAKLGLEWTARLVQEPRRLFLRYLLTNTMFCLLVGRTLAARMIRQATTKT
jgi:N-acetylglucosaminyldiphosphoundecaprenol N-acetyl-beta-D-mannosaminyltransferase